jgi:DNA-directed RNA polymerase specialized sigma24 family protein
VKPEHSPKLLTTLSPEGQHPRCFDQHIRQHLLVRVVSVTSASRRRRGFRIVDALDREWCELVRNEDEAVARWGDRHEVLAPYSSLDDVLSGTRLNSDSVLAALLTEFSAGDQLAGRVVLQALIGRMVCMAERDPRASVDDYLARLWCVIGSYPLKRRPVRIAANLSMDTLKAISREHRWLGRVDVTLWPSSESLEEILEPTGLDGSPYDSPPPVDVEVQRVLVASSMLRLIGDSDASLLRSIYADGMSSTQAARQFHTSAGMVRVRCSKVVRQLATHAVGLADAAA